MKRFIIPVVSISIFVMSLVMPVPALAVAGCRGKVIDKMNSWINDVTYTDWHPGNRLPSEFKVRLTGVVVYQYCPNKSNPDKVRPKNISWCWTQMQDRRGAWFDGVKFNPIFRDASQSSNPEQITVEDPNGDAQQCEVQRIPKGERRWLMTRLLAHWSVSSWIILIGRPDQHHDFVFKGGKNKPFRPKKDPNTSGWYK